MAKHTPPIYIYMCVCVCVCVRVYVRVCVCVWLGSSRSFKHVSFNNKGTFCPYNLINPFEFPDKCLGVRLELVDEFESFFF